MEKAVLKTLIYADIFDYPLAFREIIKWLISSKANLRQIEKIVEKLIKAGKIETKKGFYFLPGRANLINLRIKRKRQSERYFYKVKLVAAMLRIIPWIKLVGVSGGLALDNAGRTDDIDFFIITEKGRLWLSRLLTLLIISLTGQRRKRGESERKSAGKICCNLFLEDMNLEQKYQDLYTAHEVLQMKTIWQRGSIYQKYLLDNEWAFKFLPNWVGDFSDLSLRGAIATKQSIKAEDRRTSFAMTLEYLAKKFQLIIMESPKGMERIEEGALYFHPTDTRSRIMSQVDIRFKVLYKLKRPSAYGGKSALPLSQ